MRRSSSSSTSSTTSCTTSTGTAIRTAPTSSARYGVANARLFVGDGRSFCEPPPRRASASEPATADAAAAAAHAPEAEAAGADVEQAAAEAAAETGAARPTAREGAPRAKRRRGGGGGGAAQDCATRAPLFIGSALAAPAAAAEGGGEEEAAAGAVAAAEEATGGGVGPSGVSVAARHGYDKVLVDAECTHDGSIKHLAKFESWGWETFEQVELAVISRDLALSRSCSPPDLLLVSFTCGQRFLQPERLATLRELQALCPSSSCLLPFQPPTVPPATLANPLLVHLRPAAA